MTKGWCLVQKSYNRPMVCTEHIPGLHSAWQDWPSVNPPLVFATRREARAVAKHINTYRCEGWDKCVVRALWELENLEAGKGE